LILGDVVGQRPHVGQIEAPVLHVPELVHLAEAAEDAGAVGLDLAVLLDDPELHGEPEDVGDELHRVLGLQAQ